MQDKEADEFRHTTAWQDIWQIFNQDKIALTSLYLFLILIICACLAPFIAPYSSEQQFIGLELLPPSWADEGKIAYFFWHR